jgi:hypothetical protein
MDQDKISATIQKINSELANLREQEKSAEPKEVIPTVEAGEEEEKPEKEMEKSFKIDQKAIWLIVDPLYDAIQYDIQKGKVEEDFISSVIKDFNDMARQLSKVDSESTELLADLFSGIAKELRKMR